MIIPAKPPAASVLDCTIPLISAILLITLNSEPIIVCANAPNLEILNTIFKFPDKNIFDNLAFLISNAIAGVCCNSIFVRRKFIIKALLSFNSLFSSYTLVNNVCLMKFIVLF